MLIIPAILEKNFQEIKRKIKLCEGNFEIVQIDICDGKFVKNRTWNNPIQLKKLKTKTKFEIHLMVEDPVKEINNWTFKNIRRIIAHSELLNRSIIKNLRNFKKRYSNIELGIALNPPTPLEVLTKFPLSVFSEVLFLAVNPGKQGEKFQSIVFKKIKQFQNFSWRPKKIKIGVDGGLDKKLVKSLFKMKIDYANIGSYLWKNFHSVLGLKLEIFLNEYGKLYSQELGIKLNKKDKNEIFKWFLASILFGARISETIAKNTYRTFKRYNLLTPKKILKAGRDFLINPIMREGGYVRYDGKTSDKILKICHCIIEKLNNNLNNLEKEAKDPKDLEKRIQDFYGVGPVTTQIFLRELREIWRKADPDIGKYVKEGAKKFGLEPSLKKLKDFWQKNKIKGYKFKNFEVALLRYGKVKE